jgi:hypothetical protein
MPAHQYGMMLMRRAIAGALGAERDTERLACRTIFFFFFFFCFVTRLDDAKMGRIEM